MLLLQKKKTGKDTASNAIKLYEAGKAGGAGGA